MAEGLSCPQLVSQTAKEGLNFSSWVEVNLNALAHNLLEIKKHTTSPILPIIKGNAYGHGAPVVAAFLQSLGHDFLGVSSLEEALTILEFTNPTLLLLTPPTVEQLPLVLKHKLIPTITSLSLLQSLAHLAKIKRQLVTVHLKLDTGFGRLGAEFEECLKMVELIKKTPHLKLGGIFTHFSKAFKDLKYTHEQLNILLLLRQKLILNPPILWHAANSAALINLPESHLDLVRVGTLLYGQSPVPLDSSWNLQETWACKARILQIRTLPRGHFVGYGGTYKTTKPTVVGVVAVGFNQGLDIEPQGNLENQLKHVMKRLIHGPKLQFNFENKTLPIMGKIAMGLTCVNLNSVPEAKVGSTLTIPMRRVTSNPQLPHIYHYKGQTHCIFWNHKVFINGRWRTNLQGVF